MFEPPLSHPVSISVLEDWIYWVNMGPSEVTIIRHNKRIDGDDTDTLKTIPIQFQPLRLKVYHSLAQAKQRSPCSSRVTDCSHLCVPLSTPSGPTTSCLCPRNSSSCSVNSTELEEQEEHITEEGSISALTIGLIASSVIILIISIAVLVSSNNNNLDLS